jgi:hypothetical protein
MELPVVQIKFKKLNDHRLYIKTVKGMRTDLIYLAHRT